jgi:predicted nucleotidyltransferase
VVKSVTSISEQIAHEGVVKYMKSKYSSADLSTITFIDMDASEFYNAERKAVATKEEALHLGRMFASIVRSEVESDALVFVFGSTMKNEANLGSDIDIAVVSKVFDRDFIGEAGRVGCLAYAVSEDIELHAVACAEWQKGNPHILEIQKYGIAV